MNAEINAQLLFSLSKGLLVQLCEEGPSWPCLGLSVSVSDFENLEVGNRQLTSFFTRKEDMRPRTSANLGSLPLSIQVRDENSVAHSVRKRHLSDSGGSQLPTSPSETGIVLPIASEHKKARTFISKSSPSCRDSASPPDHEVELYDCPKCNNKILATAVLEHLDWHVAMELQQTDE